MNPGLLLLTLSLIGIARPVGAEIMVTPTLEWLADHCIDSGVYVVTGVSKRDEADSFCSVTLSLKRTLRGEPVPSVTETYADFRPSQQRSKPLVAKGHEFLVCFQHDENGDRRTVQLINLTYPQLAGANVIAVDSHLELLADGTKIMKAFEARLETHPKADPVRVGDRSRDNRLELDTDSDVYRAIYAGSSCFLLMPTERVGKE